MDFTLIVVVFALVTMDVKMVMLLREHAVESGLLV